METKIVCWDLDGTIGKFDALESSHGELWVREGIPQLLEKCQCEYNVTNVLTTNANRTYADLALSETGLQKFFDNVYDGSQIMDLEGKRYSLVFNHYELNQRQYAQSALVIGNSVKDLPSDCKGVISILDFTKSGQVDCLDYIITKLVSNRNEFYKNFRRLLHEAKKENGEKIFYTSTEERCTIGHIYNKSTKGKKLKIPLILIQK